jgi:hypothetical protein
MSVHDHEAAELANDLAIANAEIERLTAENAELRQANIEWARRNLYEVRDEVHRALEGK